MLRRLWLHAAALCAVVLNPVATALVFGQDAKPTSEKLPQTQIIVPPSDTTPLLLPDAEPKTDTAAPTSSATLSSAAASEPLPWWRKVPPVRAMPRFGPFPIPPSGPGYYSAVDLLFNNWREAPPKYPYSAISPMPHSFFDADFRYLDDPKNTHRDSLDCLHRIHLGENWLFDTGGEFRYRFMHEQNSRLTGATQNYHLTRTRVYGDLWFQDRARAYVEFLSAHIFNNSLPALAIDSNPADLLNAFVDVKVADCCDHPAYVRIGRQEMLLGSQRLVSPLDWANTRRTFQGVRAFRQGEKFDIDGFWMQPVLPDAANFDWGDPLQNFAGGWLTYRRDKGQFFDVYYLMLNNQRAVTQAGVVRSPFTAHTFGFRYAGNNQQFLYDFEDMIQFGDRGGNPMYASATTAGVGWNFAKVCMNPTLWFYYDYASGDADPNAGMFSTFNQLYAFGHYYMGWLDLIGRQNIHDINAHLYFYPLKSLMVWLQFHHFDLDSPFDALYNAGGNATRRSAAGVAGRTVGDELDFVVNFHLGPHTDLLTGFSVLFPRDFIPNTGAGNTPQLYYTQVSFRW